MSQKPTIKIKRLNPTPSSNSNSNFEKQLKQPIILQGVSRPRPDDLQPWSIQCLIDELTISLLNVKVTFCMLVGLDREARKKDLRNLGRGVLRRIYEEQARYKMYRIPIFLPPPVFVIHLKHLDDRLKQELLTLEQKQGFCNEGSYRQDI
jgi:hypothetical protein